MNKKEKKERKPNWREYTSEAHGCGIGRNGRIGWNGRFLRLYAYVRMYVREIFLIIIRYIRYIRSSDPFIKYVTFSRKVRHSLP